MKKLIDVLLVSAIVVAFSISGIHNKQDINDVAYVIAIGIDVGAEDNYKVSFQIAIPSKNASSSDSSSGSSSETSDTVIDSVECPSVEYAISLAHGYVSKRINLSHCKALVISEQIASTRYF